MQTPAKPAIRPGAKAASETANAVSRVLDRLRTFPILSQVGTQALEAVAPFVSWHRYNPTEVIYSESDPSTDVWFIVDGSVRAVLRTPAGRELLINELGPGEMFGEVAAIDGAGRTASVSAVTKTRLCSIPAKAFLEAAQSTPAAFHALLEALTRILRRQVKRMQEREALPARLRLCAELVRLSRARDAADPDHDRVVSPPPPHRVLAARIGSSRETVSRELGELIKQGLVRRSHGAFVLPTPAALEGGLDGEAGRARHHDAGEPDATAETRRYFWSQGALANLRHTVQQSGVFMLVGCLAACAGSVAGSGQAPNVITVPPGFSTDTTTWAGLARGATATEEACRALPDALWVRADGRVACLRYTAVGMQMPMRTPVVLLGGDPPSATYLSIDGRNQLHRSGPGQAPSISSRLTAVAGVAGSYRIPTIVLARPGMEGSSGDHAADRHTHAEVHLVNDALSQLKARYGFTTLAVAGFSSGGTLAANLLSSRSDIRCAVLASAPLNLREFYSGRDGAPSDRTSVRSDLADPMRSVGLMQSPAMIWVIGDPRDRKVPPALWSNWAVEARRHGARVALAYTAPVRGEGQNPRDAYHHDSSLPLRIAGACAAGHRVDRLRNAPARSAVELGSTATNATVISPESRSEAESAAEVVSAVPTVEGSDVVQGFGEVSAIAPSADAVVTGVVAYGHASVNALGADVANIEMGADVVITDGATANLPTDDGRSDQ